MKTEDIDFYNKIKEKYKDDIGMLVTYANHQGDTDLLKELADNGKLPKLSNGTIYIKRIFLRVVQVKPSSFTWIKAYPSMHKMLTVTRRCIMP